jgi:membrane protein implicated in regulation of membrane protease activity
VFLLIDAPIPELRVPIAFLVPLAGAVTLVAVVAVRLAVLSQRAPGPRDARRDRHVREELAPAGKVFVHGETWNASAPGRDDPRASARARAASRGPALIVEPDEPTVRT